jgi:hypothetical protein
MEPDIPKNTFILIQRVDPELLKEGDNNNVLFIRSYYKGAAKYS